MVDGSPVRADTEEDAPDRPALTTIERALTVLGHFATCEQEDHGVSEIARELQLSKAVIHRVVTTLVANGYLQVDPRSRRYRLGPMTLVLGSSYLERLDLHKLALPRLRELSEATGETATLSLRSGWSRMYVDQVTPDREIIMMVAIGKPFPLHAGSSSKSFLAFLDDHEQHEYLERNTLRALTPTTIVDPGALRDELQQVRALGYAVSVEERQAGAASIATPILDRRGRPLAVISVGGPVERFRHQLDTLPSLLIDVAGSLARFVGNDGARAGAERPRA